ncbi:hypothetical protein L0V05_12710 [Tabrizicola sp. J26]|uniref:hypothetical protein n=1 Tax=Alitabrizicola rongguiensis TaxID=2909234 RepID=UPI001F1E31C7|nr:hypothetical protein [Tabrizicola rongguiensis]MCF1709674.1 hypothetical protein [Tabrizicola rongguiensis]
MRTFGAMILILLAVMTGGCSLLFSPYGLQDVFQGFSGGVGWIWLVGVGITLLAIRGAVRLLRRPAPATPPLPRNDSGPTER